MSEGTTIYILGAGGHGKVVADIIRRNNFFENIHFLDDRFSESVNFGDYRIVGVCLDFRGYLSGATAFFVAIGENRARQGLFDLLQADGAKCPAIVCSSAIVSSAASCGFGSLVMPGAVVNADAQIGNNVIVNSRAIIEHDCIVGSHSHLAPGAILTGDVQVGSRTTIGAGAVVCPGVCVGDDILVGAGAVITSDIHAPGCYYGVPAKLRAC